jgi:hypothetical protein
MRNLGIFISCLAMSLSGCGAGEEEDIEILDFEDFFGGKMDTGYVGSQAMEIEATLTSQVAVTVPGTPEELTAIAAGLRTNPSLYGDIVDQVSEQVKYARNTLQKAAVNLNLEGGTPTFTNVTVVAGGLVLDYQVTIESLIKFKDLKEGQTPESLVGQSYEMKLPYSPTGLLEKIKNQCATDPDDASAPVPVEELGAHNLFFYWDPARAGCPLAAEELRTARFVINSSLDTPNVYPEFDRLTADGLITMVAVFGQIDHGELKPDDWGFVSFDTFTRELERRGFEVTESFDNNTGHRMEKTYDGGLKVSVKMLTPVDFADNVPREQANQKFFDALRNHEVVYYAGHAFYGSLTVLEDPTSFPANTYQVIFMDACWSYAYYTKQVFRNKATPDDASGWGLVDVINNTEPSVTGSEVTAAILWHNFFKGAAAAHKGSSTKVYSWNNLIKYMNENAQRRADQRKEKDPEIYGVSGVRTNQFGQAPSSSGGDSGTAHVYEFTTPTAIPDEDSYGIAPTISVPTSESGATGSLAISVTITHSYIGDLAVWLEHGGKSFMLHNYSGGGTQNLNIQVQTDVFAGTRKSGDWVLRVKDVTEQDVGTLDRWSIAFPVPAS